MAVVAMGVAPLDYRLWGAATPTATGAAILVAQEVAYAVQGTVEALAVNAPVLHTNQVVETMRALNGQAVAEEASGTSTPQPHLVTAMLVS